MLFRLCLLLSLLSIGSLGQLSPAQNHWAGYRGSNGDGHAFKDSNPPSNISEEANVVWKTSIHGKGWSSPVVWGNQIWLTTATPDGKKMSVLCVDKETGKIEVDRVVFENKDPDFCHSTNSYASPTPVIEEGRVYVHFGSYGTACLETGTGKSVWERRDLKCDHWRGPASSPILYQDKLIVAYDGHDQQYVVALDKRTGKTAWKHDRKIDYSNDDGDWKKAYATGAVFQVKGKPILVYPSAMATSGLDVDTGKEIWIAYHGGMNSSSRPVMSPEGRVIVTNGMGKMVAIVPEGKGDVTKTHLAWTLSKGAPKKSSPLIVEDMMYTISDKGILSQVDPESGEVIWLERLKGAFAASPVHAGGLIYIANESGTVFVIRPGDEYDLVFEGKFADGFMASPACVGNEMILRSKTALYLFKEK